MLSATTIKAYIAELVGAFRKIELMDFLHELHARFNPDQDLSFMEYFLGLCSEENEGQFIVHHEKLIEFGVATTDRSSAIKKRLAVLGMAESVDFTLQHVLQRGTSGAQTRNTYFLTPKAFKLCLMRAQKRSDQEIDVQMYAEYFLFIEKVIYYYAQYESEYKQALLRNKDGVIDSLREEMAEIKIINLDQSVEIKQLLDLAYDTNSTVHALNRSHIRKSRLCTVVLANKNLEHYYGSTMMLLHDSKGTPYVRIQNVRAQRKKVVATMTKYIEGDYVTNRNLPVKANHAITIPPIYFPNATVLINRVVERFTKIVRKQKIKDFNDTFKAEIKAREKTRLTISTFPVKMSSLSFEYYPNEVMSFNEVIMMVVEEIKGAQGSAIDLPASKQLSILADKHRALAEKRFVKNGSANEKKLLASLNDDIAQAARDLSDNIFKGVFETPPTSDESESESDDEE